MIVYSLQHIKYNVNMSNIMIAKSKQDKKNLFFLNYSYMLLLLKRIMRLNIILSMIYQMIKEMSGCPLIRTFLLQSAMCP